MITTAEDKEIVISSDHEEILRKVMQLDDNRKIPKKTLELYDEFRTALRRGGAYFDNGYVALIPIFLNQGPRPGIRTFVDEAKEDGNVKYGTRIVGYFRDHWQLGKFVKMDRGFVVVLLDASPAEERKLKVTAVRLATKEDLKKAE